MTDEKQTPDAPRPSFGERLGRAFKAFWRFIVRLVLVLLVLGLIAGAIYLAVPYFYRHYVQPLEDLQAQVDTLQQQTVDRAQQVNQRLGVLQQDLADLQANQQALSQQMEDLQGNEAQIATRLDALETQAKALDSQIQSLEARLDKQEDAAQSVQATAEALQSAWAQWETRLQAMQLQVGVLQTLESLTRARLLLSQENYGLAASELQRAAAAVAWLQAHTDEHQETLGQAARQIALAHDALPDKPQVSVQDVEAAWQLLVELLPQAAATATPSATEPSSSASETAIPAAGETATPTPTPTPKP